MSASFYRIVCTRALLRGSGEFWLENSVTNWHQWLMPAILATQEAEIRRIKV
jgi:hypothetical protein